MSKYWVLFLTILGGSILALLLWRSPPDELSQLITKPPGHTMYPTTILKNASTSEYNNEGKLIHNLMASTIHYYDNPDKKAPNITIDKPKLTVYQNQQIEPKVPQSILLTLTSAKAEANEKEDFLNLIGDVSVMQFDDDNNVIQLNTEALMVQPHRRYAETNKPVIIQDQSGTITATGLKISFDEERIELLSNVKGKYAPN